MIDRTTHYFTGGWDTTRFEPSPDSPPAGSRPGDWANYFDEVRHLTGDRRLGFVIQGLGTDGLTRPKFVAAVLKKLRVLDAEYPRRHLGRVHHRPWHWAALYGSGVLPHYVEYCPRLQWRMSKERGQVFSFPAYCKSWQCATRCAEVRANDDLQWACSVFLGAPWSYENLNRSKGVWHTVVPFDPTLFGRLNARRSRARAGLVWYLREKEGEVHIYSSVDLTRRSKREPTGGAWLTPWDALLKLVNVTLVLPGITDRRWNGSWRPVSGDDEATTFDLGRAPRQLMEDAEKAGEARVEALLGPYARDRLTPAQVEAVWLPIMREEVDREWGMWKATGEEE